MISHENLCLNHVFMPRCLCFELIFCTRNSVAQKEGQNFSDLALLARAYHASFRHHALVRACLVANIGKGDDTVCENMDYVCPSISRNAYDRVRNKPISLSIRQCHRRGL